MKKKDKTPQRESKIAQGAIKSDTGVQGLPCEGAYRQGKPCSPGLISNTVLLCASLLIARRSQK